MTNASAKLDTPKQVPGHRSSAVKTMQAVVATGYGSPDVLTVTERARPTPKEHEVLIKVIATNVSAADSMMRRGDPAYARLFLGLMKPKKAVPGTGLAGVIEAIGDGVTLFKVGDAVFGEAGLNFGAHAEYVCVSEDGVLVQMPDELSFEEAATMCDGPMTSLNFLKRVAALKAGQHVLVNGASGALGTAAVQLAKSFGAEVTAVCSAANIDLVKSLGADHVIDYQGDDFTQRHAEYDVVYDTVGKRSYGRCKKSLKPGGIYMSPVLNLVLLLQVIWTGVFGTKKAKFDATGLRAAPELRSFLRELKERLATGALRVVIERVYALDQIAEAHAHVDGGHKRGNIVVRMAGQAQATRQ